MVKLPIFGGIIIKGIDLRDGIVYLPFVQAVIYLIDLLTGILD